MSAFIYACCNEKRKAAVLGNPTLNGIDYLEVLDHQAKLLSTPTQPSPRQRTLVVHFLNPLPQKLDRSQILISGGESILNIGIEWTALATDPGTTPPTTTPNEVAYFNALPDAPNVLVVRTTVAGDFSPYLFRIVNSAPKAGEDSFDITETLPGFDPELSEVEFSFKVECPPYFDCAPSPAACSPDLPPPPPINYLAKDYGSFRSILLDRLMQLVPGWAALTEADMGVVLAELIAYVGDNLSYQQDAVATEAYIETARSRISLRRHALLVDYLIHDGSNARSWIHLDVNAQAFLDRNLARFYTFASNMPSTLAIGAGNEEAALSAGVIVFESMQNAVLFPEHNQMLFYTWGDADCCLPMGATEATLLGSYPNLQPGDVLVFEEVMGPQTGSPADADLRHRYAVRLTEVATETATGSSLVDPLFAVDTGDPVISLSQTPTAVTEIQWAIEDALPFPLCLSSTYVDETGKAQHLQHVSVVLGNNVLADQGLSLDDIALDPVPEPSIFPPNTNDRCQPKQPVGLPVRYRPVLPDLNITQAVPLPVAGSPVTPGIVPLVSSGFSNLVDTNGFTAAAVQAVDPSKWPTNFGVLAQANSVNPSNIDLTVVYDPASGPYGVPTPVALEQFVNCSLNPADSNYAATQINAQSQLIRVPAGFVPFGTTPAGFPANPIRLPNSGAINLVDGGGNPYLTVQATNPLGWPQLFGVLAQDSQQKPDEFNLLVVYNPPSGTGVETPVLIEQFDNLTLQNLPLVISDPAELIRVRSFLDEPNPALSAYALMHYDANEALPAVELTSAFQSRTTQWLPRANLLQSGPADTNFVIEIEYDGSAHLRFGDGTNGERPSSGALFSASYRVGNGAMGNVGAETLVYSDTGDARIVKCTNPMAASGGVDPETNEQIRRRAPQAFLTQERAITMSDYQDIADRNSQVRESAASLRWTGSWYTVFLAAEPKSGGALPASLAKALKRFVNRYRLAGQDLEITSPNYVPLEIELTVCVDPNYFQADVRQALTDALGSRTAPNGQRGLFSRHRFTFGETVYLSPIYAAARKVAGVTSVTATVFTPQGTHDTSFLAKGEIPLGPTEIAQMENDPSFPAHGQLKLVLKGGK
ncbi:MAG TPA: putative baseplate assembly protein [Terracidiphilus sp.]|jgi:hypothetical protein